MADQNRKDRNHKGEDPRSNVPTPLPSQVVPNEPGKLTPEDPLEGGTPQDVKSVAPSDGTGITGTVNAERQK